MKSTWHLQRACLQLSFDTIDHATLTDSLASWFGVCGTALKWFTSYSTDRFQAVKVGSSLSKFSKLLYGVPQGFVLGPLLFSLYTTPLKNKIIGNHCGIKYHFYTDDTQLYIHLSSDDAPTVLNKLSTCLSDIQTCPLAN